MDLLNLIKENAKKNLQRIVLPESFEERTLKAADIILKEKLAKIILIGNPEKIKNEATKLGLTHIGDATVIDHENNPKEEQYIDLMVELRKSKGLTREDAKKLLRDPLYLATVMIKSGDADGEVAGADNATGDVLRPAFQYVKTLPGISVVSGAFLMFLKDKNFGEDGLMVFADCAVHPYGNGTASGIIPGRYFLGPLK